MRFLRPSLLACLAASLSGVVACGDDGATGPDNEVITTVILTFTPSAGGTPLVFEWDDPDGAGGDEPVIDPIALTAGGFTATVGFENRLEDPPEVITTEVLDESDEHQIFWFGTAVDGPASDQPGAPLTHEYADQDVNGLPVGLENTITAIAGTGQLTVVLRHLPPVNGVAVKTADLAAQVRDTGIDSIAGSTDARVNFEVTVQ